MTSKPEDHNNHTTIKIKDRQFSRFALLPINLMALCYTIYTATYFFFFILGLYYSSFGLGATPQFIHFLKQTILSPFPLPLSKLSYYWLPPINRKWVGLLTS